MNETLPGIVQDLPDWDPSVAHGQSRVVWREFGKVKHWHRLVIVLAGGIHLLLAHCTICVLCAARSDHWDFNHSGFRESGSITVD